MKIGFNSNKINVINYLSRKSTTYNRASMPIKKINYQDVVIINKKEAVTQIIPDKLKKEKVEELFNQYKNDEGEIDWFIMNSNHPLKAYSEALTQLPYNINRLYKYGKESVVFKLDDGNILKLSTQPYRKYNPEIDIPQIENNFVKLNESHIFNNQNFNKVYYLIQKRGNTSVDWAGVEDFIKNVLEPAGYEFIDAGESQLAYYYINGPKNPPKIFLIDSGAVRKISK